MKIAISLLSLLAICAFSPNVLTKSHKAGFSGEISLLTLILENNSNLNGRANARRDSQDLASGAKLDFRAFPIMLGKLNFTFGEQLQQQLFVGTSREEFSTGTLAIETGYQYRTQAGTQVFLSYLPTIIQGEVWRDPYIINAERQKAKTQSDAFRLQFKRLFSLPLNI